MSLSCRYSNDILTQCCPKSSPPGRQLLHHPQLLPLTLRSSCIIPPERPSSSLVFWGCSCSRTQIHPGLKYPHSRETCSVYNNSGYCELYSHFYSPFCSCCMHLYSCFCRRMAPSSLDSPSLLQLGWDTACSCTGCSEPTGYTCWANRSCLSLSYDCDSRI